MYDVFYFPKLRLENIETREEEEVNHDQDQS